MKNLRFRSAENAFLDPDRIDADRAHHARAIIIPFGLEASVSYGKGTQNGPEAIIRASHALEHFDEELWCEPYKDFGVATLDTGKIDTTLEGALDPFDVNLR